MKSGELLVVASNLAPMRLRARPFYKIRRLRNLASLSLAYKKPSQQTPNQNGQAGGSKAGAAKQRAKQMAQQVIQIVQRRPGSSGQVKP